MFHAICFSPVCLYDLVLIIFKLGLERFHSVAILGFNAPEWFISAVGAVFAG